MPLLTGAFESRGSSRSWGTAYPDWGIITKIRCRYFTHSPSHPGGAGFENYPGEWSSLLRYFAVSLHTSWYVHTQKERWKKQFCYLLFCKFSWIGLSGIFLFIAILNRRIFQRYLAWDLGRQQTSTLPTQDNTTQESSYINTCLEEKLWLVFNLQTLRFRTCLALFLLPRVKVLAMTQLTVNISKQLKNFRPLSF